MSQRPASTSVQGKPVPHLSDPSYAERYAESLEDPERLLGADWEASEWASQSRLSAKLRNIQTFKYVATEEERTP